MNIAQRMKTSGVHLSCEMFPPKESVQVEESKSVARELCALGPAYISVTYGAAGNAPHFTRELSQCVQEAGVAALSHLTCVNDTKDKIGEVLDGLERVGVRNVLALRGDIPQGFGFPQGDRFLHAEELVAAIAKRGGFCVGAACYPEGHPEAASRDADLDFLKRKVDAGASFLTTQMFFDNHILYNFLFRALRKGIDVPVAAGVMPVVNAKQIKRIVALSGASLPSRFQAVLDRFGGNPACMRQAGIAYATEQIIDLFANGVSCVHLYTMNRPEIAKSIFDNLGCILEEGHGK